MIPAGLIENAMRASVIDLQGGALTIRGKADVNYTVAQLQSKQGATVKSRAQQWQNELHDSKPTLTRRIYCPKYPCCVQFLKTLLSDGIRFTAKMAHCLHGTNLSTILKTLFQNRAKCPISVMSRLLLKKLDQWLTASRNGRPKDRSPLKLLIGCCSSLGLNWFWPSMKLD